MKAEVVERLLQRKSTRPDSRWMKSSVWATMVRHRQNQNFHLGRRLQRLKDCSQANLDSRGLLAFHALPHYQDLLLLAQLLVVSHA